MRLEKIQAYDKLINAVQRRPALWDNSIKEHKNGDVVSAQWAQVAEEVNMSVVDVMKKFKNIRDTYVKESRKQVSFKKSNPQDGFTYEPTWPLFKKMSFLKDIVISRSRSKYDTTELQTIDGQTLQRILESSNVTNDDASFTSTDSATPTSSTSITPGMLTASTTPTMVTQSTTSSANKRKKPNENSTTLCTQLASIGNQLLEENKYDPLEHFSLSLVPHLRRIPEHKLLQCQVQILEVLVAYTEDS